MKTTLAIVALAALGLAACDRPTGSAPQGSEVGAAMPDTNAAKARLEAQLAELEDRLSRLDRDLSETPDPDSSERAVQMEDDEALEGQAQVAANEIASVRRALERIEDGSYGQCVKCGEEIAEGRLEVRPEAALCIDCASEAG